MKRILASMVLMVLLFPALASGETVKWKDLVKLDGLLYRKFTDVPFTGEVTSKAVAFFRREAPLTLRGRVKDGKKDGLWVRYWRTGNLRSKGTYKNGKKVGPWVHYYDNGKLSSKGTYKNGEKDGPWVKYDEDGR